MRLITVVLLLVAVACAANAHTGAPRRLFQATKNQTDAFAATHSANGSAIGTVSWTGHGTGEEIVIGGLNAYVASPTTSYNAAVLVVTDIYGYKADGIRVWSDNLAKQGFLVIVPDYFKGNPRTPQDPPSTFAQWGAQFPRQQVLNETDAVLADIRAKYPAVQNIGVAGFCWGGLYAVLLTHAPPQVNASVVYHGSLLTPEDIQAIAAPISFQQSDPELDNQIKTEFYNQIKAILEGKAAQGLDTGIT